MVTDLICTCADGAAKLREFGLRLATSVCGLARRTRRTRAAGLQNTLLHQRIRREILIADVARARRRKKKAPLRELYSATHDILRREVQSAGIPAALNSYPRGYSTSGGD